MIFCLNSVQKKRLCYSLTKDVFSVLAQKFKVSSQKNIVITQKFKVLPPKKNIIIIKKFKLYTIYFLFRVLCLNAWKKHIKL